MSLETLLRKALFYLHSLPATQPQQFRINSSSKCSNCHGPLAFGDPAVLCVKFVLYYMQQWCILESLDFRGKLSERGAYILHML